MTLTPEQLQQWRALAERATPGPWRNGADPSHFDAPEVTDDKTFSYWITKDADAAFVAAAREAVPQLLHEVERLRGIEAIAKLEAMLGLGEPVRPDIHVRVVRQRDSAIADRDRLRKALREACNGWENYVEGVHKSYEAADWPHETVARIAELRKLVQP